MKRRNNRFLAGTLAGLMMLTMLPVTALAAENGTADETATLTAESIAPVSETLNSSTANVVNDDKDSPAEKAESNDSTDQQGDSSSNTGENSDSNPSANNNGEGSENSTAEKAKSNDSSDKQGDSSSNTTGNSDSNPSANNNGEGGENNTPAPTFTAKIDGTEYETLDAAINAAQDGDTIEIGENCTLTVGTIEKAVVINGNGHTITVPAQEPGNHALNVNAPLTFNNANVVFTNDIDNVNQWSVTMNSDGVLTLDKGSTCTIETHGIYANANAVINVKGGSELTIRNTTYTAMMGENYALLNIENDSHLLIENSAINGMTRFITTVTGSTLRVLNCANQGLVRCPLTLDDSTAEISGNNYGISGYNKTDVLTMKNRSSMTMEDNKSAGIFLYGGNIDVQDGTTLTITGTGKDLDNTDDRSVGALAVYYLYNTYTANVTFADGASVNLVDNAVSAINNDGTLYIGKGTTITNNGSKALYGGGIQNRGDITIAPDTKVYNNHASVAGDDIYNTTGEGMDRDKNTVTYTGSLTLSPVGENWVLDDCGDPIVGWYQDGSEMLTDTARKRWNGDAADENYYADEYTVGKEAVSDALALKAAHGKFCNVTYEVTGDIPSDAGNPPASAKVKMGGSYTVAPAQTTSQSRYTFIGWRVNGIGDIVTSLENLQQDVKLVGVWSYRSSGGSSGGGGGRKPTVDIPDDVPTGLNGDDHFAYIVGYPDGNVNPGGNITRAEVATIFFRLLTEDVRTANSTQSNSLSDVSRGQWFNHAISTLSSMGIVKGNPDGTFDPDAPITRAEFAAIAARFDDKNTNTTSNFSDIASHWAKDEIGVAANKGWINGYPDSTFRPDQYITRAEAMTLVNRVLNRLPEKSEDLLDDMIKWPDNADASVWYYLAVQEATNSHDYSDKSDADKYEKWTKIRDARDWTLLEK
ncbi:S-layer homology domain-containing protein [Agathobaculum butyriciproducens]|uniref:S-layer homology domain-containing protein n=1 Tax=Agathobaculum TaxID=2048137 RepID=UPI002096A2A3|nr:S-layer homology domain-containing protein [Agathobaculum butyriciproducens]